ncbi:tRNA(His) guanylyltransferase [Sparassis crispa]|uniref:tRNA(His) guanylyltransferase n=1 Tax=Sparassis crispa TaxID=139825 RepID=A0A401H6Y7_9APHY|nr:tRNA(His) guanylyltransferase [Sparassis crispa]GBE90143.1 tRNA(His) guanylyltransferase [Sparassis crispa]
MAGSRFEYVKKFELPDPLLPGTFLVLRIDGHAFHRLSEEHNFTKPNDERALQLMDRAARDVMDEFKDIVLAFGESDEFSFLFRRSTTLYNRRHSKILTNFCTPPRKRSETISPGDRQTPEAHINNLYNTIFWALVLKGGCTTTQAHARLRGTVSSTKHEMLFSQFGINYNELPARFRKGSILVRQEVHAEVEVAPKATDNAEGPAAGQSAKTASGKGAGKPKVETTVELLHCDIIGDEFWNERPYLLAEK